MQQSIFDTIEGSIALQDNPLSRALGDLSELMNGRGSCLYLNHVEFGEAVITDGDWALDVEETMRDRDDLTVVDMRNDGPGFSRIAILTPRQEDSAETTRQDCDVAMAALDAVEAITNIAFDDQDVTVLPPTLSNEQGKSQTAVAA